MGIEFFDKKLSLRIIPPRGNVCKFSETEDFDYSDTLSATRFIYETSPKKLNATIIYPEFGCYLITGGSAILITENGEVKISVGDMFFSFPMIPFSFKDIEDLRYLYINFVGSDVESILLSLHISRVNSVYKDFTELIDMWFLALGRCNSENFSMLAKGVIYFSISMIPFREECEEPKREEDIAEAIRKSIDISYYNEDLSIEYYAKKYKYNSKYISRKFVDTFNVTFSEYIRSCRINHACVLLRDSGKTIQEIASSVGYHDALYFSKVFKRVMKCSPTEYRNEKRKDPE